MLFILFGLIIYVYLSLFENFMEIGSNQLLQYFDIKSSQF